MCILKLLKRSGHSAAKAHEILLDARRGDKLARQWIGMLFAQRRDH